MSLGVAYADEGEYKMVRPDFIFSAKRADGAVVADIVDPHSTHLGDALSKLRGLAKYAQKDAQLYRRIESVAEVGGVLRVLDLTREDVRQAVSDATSAAGLYSSSFAADYT